MKTFLSIVSGPGNGLATAERFAKEGFQVVLSARKAPKTQVLADQLAAKGYEANVRTVDASDPSSVTALVAGVEMSFCGIEVVHHNAASMRKATITEQSPETFNSDLAVDIGGALAAVQAVIPNMSERGSGSIAHRRRLFAEAQTRTICRWASVKPAFERWRSASSKASPKAAFMLRLLRWRRLLFSVRRRSMRSRSFFGPFTASRGTTGRRKSNTPDSG